MSDNNLSVVYGMYDLRPERDEALSSLRWIHQDMDDLKHRYFRLGFHLEEFRRLKYYEDFGYLTLEEFCLNNLGLDKGAVSRCINVFLKFNARGYIEYSCGVQKRYCESEMHPCYKDYSYTQLTEMLSLSDEQCKEVKPYMTVKQIREYKKSLKKVKEKVALTQPEAEPDKDELVPLFSSEQLENEEFLEELFNRIKGVLEFLSLDLHTFERSGKQFSFKDIDGNTYKLLYMVSKKKGV